MIDFEKHQEKCPWLDMMVEEDYDLLEKTKKKMCGASMEDCNVDNCAPFYWANLKRG